MGESKFKVGDRVIVNVAGEAATKGEVHEGTLSSVTEVWHGMYRIAHKPDGLFKDYELDAATPATWTIEGVLPLIKDAQNVKRALDLICDTKVLAGELHEHPEDSLTGALEDLYRLIGSRVVEGVANANA